MGRRVFVAGLLLLLACLLGLLHTGGARQCGFPGRPRNGSSSAASNASRPGDTAHYTCRPGFTLFGEEERVCLDSGIWAGRQPLCELNLALKQTALMSATLWNYRAGLAADGDPKTCAYTPRTGEQRWWQVDLRTDHHIGSVALLIKKDIYQEFTIFVIQLLSKSEALYKPCYTFKGRFQMPRILFSCHDGQGHQGRYIYIRDDRRDQDYFALCEVEVFAHRESTACGEPEEPVAGMVTLTTDNTAMYSCVSGYRLLAEPNRTCERDGHWAGHAPQCEAISCSYPHIFPNSEVELVNQSTHWNTIVNYSCKSGYTFGPDVIQTSTTCLNSGTWEKINISCIPDGDRNLPVKLTGKEWNEETGDDHEPDDFFIGMTGLISIGIFCSLLIISLITLAVFLAKRFQSKKNVEATLQSSTNDLIIGNTKDNMYDNGTGSAPSNTTSITTSTTATVTTAPPQVLSATIDKVSVPATTMLPLFTQGQEHSKYDTLQSFPSVSSYNSTVATDIEDEHHFNRMKRIEQGIVSERMRRPPNSVYDTMRLHAAPDHAQVDPEYETVRSLQQLAAESSYDLIHPNGLVGTLNKPKGKQGRSIPSALKMFLQPSSKPTESELCDGTVPAEVLALYAQVDKSKKRKYRADMPTRLEGQMHGSHVSSQTDVCECTNYPISDIARISQESYNPPLWNGNSKDCSDTLRESNVSNGRPLPSVPSIRFIQSSSPSSDMKTQTIECDQL